MRFGGVKGRETKTEDEAPSVVTVLSHVDPVQRNSASVLPPAAGNTLFP